MIVVRVKTKTGTTSKTLWIGDNEEHRLCRPAWTSSGLTGQFQSHENRHGRYFERGFYIRTGGLFERERPKKQGPSKKVTHSCSKRGGH